MRLNNRHIILLRSLGLLKSISIRTAIWLYSKLIGIGQDSAALVFAWILSIYAQQTRPPSDENFLILYFLSSNTTSRSTILEQNSMPVVATGRVWCWVYVRAEALGQF